jgi:hypothetical protein
MSSETTIGSETPLQPKPWVRTVEVVGLDTLARLGGFRHQLFPQPQAAFNIYSRAYNAAPEVLRAVWCRDVELVPHPAWKICSERRFLVDEIGHSERARIAGMEWWPEFGGLNHVRVDQPLLGTRRPERPYFLLGGDNNHYHWVLNFVPRLMLLDQLRRQGLVPDEVTLVVPAAQSDNAMRLIAELGYGDLPIARLHDQAVWHFDELIVPSFPPHYELTPNVFNWYRSKLGSRVRTRPARRFVISRLDASAGTPRRRVRNEAEMIEALKPLGFEAVNLAAMTIAEQIDLFGDAEMVVGPHGAGFANMAFSGPAASAVVMENSWNHTFMADMIRVTGAAAEVLLCADDIDPAFEAQHTVDGVVDPEIRRSRDMRADIPALLDMVRGMLARKGRA